MSCALETPIEDETFDLEELAFDAPPQVGGETRQVAISVRGLRKSYGALEAVRGVDLDIAAGEIFGLIGPDGAGKTSVFQILGGVMSATAGRAEMYGVSAREAHPFVGYLTQAFSLYPDMTVAENLRYIGELRRLRRAEIDERGHHYLRMFDMERFTDRLAGSLSGGMKQKLALACALISEPKILLLDEPTTGVDPVSRREFWDTLVHLSGRGMTMVVATPYLDEAERCTRVALMFDGRIQQTGTPAEIKRGTGLERLAEQCNRLGFMVAGELVAQGTPSGVKAEQGGHLLEFVADRPQRAADLLKERMERWRVSLFGDRLHVIVDEDAGAGIRHVTRQLGEAGIQVLKAHEESYSLEDVFIAVVEKAKRQSVVSGQ